MKLKKATALGLAGAMTLSLAACGGSSDKKSTGSSDSGEKATVAGTIEPNKDAVNTNVTDETLNIGLGSEPSCLWGAPAGKTENEECIINAAFMDRLVNVDPTTQEVTPSLATKWEWVDSKHCKFTLRDDVTMTDGTPLVAEDVVYTVGIWKEKSPASDTGRYIDSVKADDEHTVTIGYNLEAPDILSVMAWSNFGITTEDEVKAAGGIDKVATNPVIGSGKYKFKEWKSGQYVLLERNDNYWDKDWKGYYKQIKFTFTADAAAREMAIESGDLDVAIDMPVGQAATYASSDKVTVVAYTNNQITHLWYNMGANAGATKDIKVRQAIDKAINFDALAQVATAGFGKAATAYMASTLPVYTESLTADQRKVDVEGAKALLKEAGYENGLELTILGLSTDNPNYTVIQSNLKDVGITLKINTPDTAQFVQGGFGGDYDLIVVGDGIYPRTPQACPFLRTVNIEGPGMVIGGPKLVNEKIDKMIEEYVSTSDVAKAKELANQFDKALQEEQIVTNLYEEYKAAIIAKDLKGVTTRERGYINVTNFYK